MAGARQHRGDPRRQPPLPRRRGRRLRRQVGRGLRRDRPRPGARQGRASCSARAPGRSRRSLEIGAGTGYFSLNLAQEGVVRAPVCTDVSARHARDARAQRRRGSGSASRPPRATPRRCRSRRGSFDLVLGHAVLHHLPELDAAFAEFRRVLRPGGVLLFAGEPSRHGDRLAAVPKRAGLLAAPLWRRVVRSRPRRRTGTAPAARGRRPRARVDGRRARVHARRSSSATRAAPASLTCACAARSCWPTGSAGSTARSRRPRCHEEIPRAWIQYAYRGYLLLQRVDRALLEPHLPPAGFYNLMLTARAPS